MIEKINSFERKFSPSDVCVLEKPQDIKDYFDFADPILHVDWGEDGVPEEYTPEYIAQHKDNTEIFVSRNEKSEVIGGGKVTILTQETNERLGLNEGVFANQKGALLEYTVVREDERNKGLLAVLTQKRIEWAKEHGAQYVCTEIELTNPISAYTKSRDGFVYIDVKEPGAGITAPYLVAVKPLAGQELKKNADNKDVLSEPLKKEIFVTEDSEKELKSLFNDGWIGVSVKIEKDPEVWKLILEK